MNPTNIHNVLTLTPPYGTRFIQRGDGTIGLVFSHGLESLVAAHLVKEIAELKAWKNAALPTAAPIPPESAATRATVAPPAATVVGQVAHLESAGQCAEVHVHEQDEKGAWIARCILRAGHATPIHAVKGKLENGKDGWIPLNLAPKETWMRQFSSLVEDDDDQVSAEEVAFVPDPSDLLPEEASQVAAPPPAMTVITESTAATFPA